MTDRIAFCLLAAAAFGIAFTIAMGQAAFGLAAAATGVMLARERRAPDWTRLSLFALAFVALALTTGILGLDPARSVSKIKRLLWFAAIPITATLVTTPERFRRLLVAFAAGTVVASVESCFVKPFRAWTEWKEGAPGATDYWTSLIHQGSMTDAQMIMLGLVVSLGFLAASAPSDRRARALWIAALALQAGALVLNFKRGSWVCAAAVCGSFGFILWGRRWAWLLAALAVAALALPPVRTRIADVRAELTGEKGGRMVMWTQVAPRLVREHPTGVGYAALNNDLMRAVAPTVERGRRHLHANVAQILVELGWAGLALYALWIAAAISDAGRGVARLRSRAAPAADRMAAVAVLLMLMALTLNGLVEYNFGDSEIIMVYGMLMGLAGAGLAMTDRAPGLPV